MERRSRVWVDPEEVLLLAIASAALKVSLVILATVAVYFLSRQYRSNSLPHFERRLQSSRRGVV